MRITAKYPGKCRHCGEYFEAGEQVEWTRGRGCEHITCPEALKRYMETPAKDEIAAEEAMEGEPFEDPGNRAERELAEAEYRETYGDESDFYLSARAEKAGLTCVTTHELAEEMVERTLGECPLCGSEGLCGCDEPERGNAYLDLMDRFETKGMEVYAIPASAYKVADELWMDLQGIFRNRGGKILCLAPTTENSSLLKKVVF